MKRMKLGRVGDADHVAQNNDLPVGVEAGEAVHVGHLDRIRAAVLGQFGADMLARAFDAVHEDVANGDQAGPWVGPQRLHARARVAATGADKTHAERIADGRMRETFHAHTRQAYCSNRCRGAQKLPTTHNLGADGLLHMR
jgi:hypothetical protein